MLTRKCYICGNIMEDKVSSITTRWGDYRLTIDGVKAYVCPVCGEKIYDADEVNMIQQLTQNLSEADRKSQPDLLNIKEVADLLRVSNQTVYNMIKDGRLKPIKMGREWRFIRKDINSIIYDKPYQIAARGLTGDVVKEDKDVIDKHLKDM